MYQLNPLKTKNPYTGTLANIEDPDEMPDNAAFHQGLLSLLRHYQFSERYTMIYLFL